MNIYVLSFHVFQIDEITEKYAKLEIELKEMRAKFKAEVTGFLDDEVGVMLDRISRQTLRIESRLFTYHQVINLIKTSLRIKLVMAQASMCQPCG